MTKENSQVDLLRNLITSNIEIQAMTAYSLIFNRLPAIASTTVGKSLLVLSFSFILYAFSLILTPPVHAQACGPIAEGTPPDQVVNILNQCAIQTDSFDDKVFNLNQTIALVNSLNGLITGNAPVTPQLSQILQNQSALASTGRMVAAIYSHPPASGVEYFAQEIQKFNPVKPAYAQTGGIGFSALEPIQRIWQAMRNISYIGFVIVFIVTGFMIMFRARISPQTVATVQDSIPRIVIALILVTFSYAIVGLLIDFMFLLLNVIISALAQTGLITESIASKVAFEKSILLVITSAWTDLVGTTAGTVNNLIGKTLGILGNIISATGILGGIAGLIIGVAAIFIMFRILLMLIMAYVMIIVLTIFAPFLLLFQALPGNNGAKDWFKQIVANISVFAVVALMIIFAGILGNIEAFGGSGEVISEGNIGQFPLVSGGIDINTIGKLIGFGFLFMIPSAAKLVKERLSIREGGVGFGAGAAALGAGAAALSRPAGFVAGPTVRAAQWKTGDWATRQIGRALPFGKKSGDQPDATTAIPPHQREHR